jgi:hypothetical protein
MWQITSSPNGALAPWVIYSRRAGKNRNKSGWVKKSTDSHDALLRKVSQ